METKKTIVEIKQERFDLLMAVLGGITEKQFRAFLKGIDS